MKRIPIRATAFSPGVVDLSHRELGGFTSQAFAHRFGASELRRSPDLSSRYSSSYGSRRGNDEVMARVTFANIRIVNKLLKGEVGPKTIHIPTGEKLSVFEVAMVTAPVPTNFPASDSLSTKQILCPTPLRVASPCSGFSKPLFVSPMAGAISRSSFSTPSDNVGAKITSSLSPSIKQEPSRTLPSTFGSTVGVAASSQAVPQARKASLARFLEKRNERVKNATPYSTSKKNHETGCDLESANASSISSSTDVNLSSNWSWIPNCP